MPDPFPDEVEQERWDKARRRADAIHEFLRQQPNRATIGDVTDLATELGVSQATAYRLIRLFRKGATVTSLVDRKRGRPKDHRTLDKEREEIIRTTIASFYMKPTRPPFSRLVREVQTNCISVGLGAAKLAHDQSPFRKYLDIQQRAKLRGETKILKQATQASS